MVVESVETGVGSVLNAFELEQVEALCSDSMFQVLQVGHQLIIIRSQQLSHFL